MRSRTDGGARTRWGVALAAGVTRHSRLPVGEPPPPAVRLRKGRRGVSSQGVEVIRPGLCAVAMISLPSTAAAQPHIVRDPVPGAGSWTLVENGDFETGSMDRWRDFDPSKGVFRTSDTESFAGGFSAVTVGARDGSGPGYSSLATPVETVIGETYVLSAFMHRGNVAEGAMYLDLSDVPSDPHVSVCLDVDGWHFGWRTWVADRTSVTVRIVRDSSWSVDDAAYFDEVALTPLAEFSPPDSTYVSCYADCDPSGCPGSLDLFDFLCFQNAFGVGDDYADCDGTGMLDFFDFLCYQNLFSAGCP